ncbi:MAG TPA: EAL domain-containing protein, partial [Gammaproteobacteria bacterium]|nr:EAL domain-containing protein [Gammaproteobacteria bacterium]
ELVGTINSMSGKIRDVIATEVSRAEAFRREAFHDPLSGLDNRLSFEQRFNEWLQAKSEIYSGALFLVELNNFKAFNQKHGFRRGDELIVHAARALAEVWNGRQAIRARLGGATFALAVENVDFEEAQRLAAAVCAHFELTLSEQGYSPEVGFACGGCHFGNIKPTQSALFSGADMGLIKAQNQGLNTWAMVRIGDDVRDEKGSQYWKTAISRALEDNRLALYTQPVLPIGGGAPLQHEIVGRLIDERGEPIAAGDFLPMAVRHNLVELLDRKVIEKLVRYLVDKPAPAAQYALNISARSIRNVAFVKWLSELLRSHHVVARRLVFETTEIGVVQDIETAKRFAQTIRGAGAQFAVDNFGLHREAFRYLQALFPNYIKPSRGFFEHLQQHRENQFFIASVVKIAQPLEIQVIAQAIEDTSVLSILRTLGVHGYQGYATGKPERLV